MFAYWTRDEQHARVVFEGHDGFCLLERPRYASYNQLLASAPGIGYILKAPIFELKIFDRASVHHDELRRARGPERNISSSEPGNDTTVHKSVELELDIRAADFRCRRGRDG